MGLLDEIKSARPKVGGRCSIPMFLDSLSDKDRADVEAALADPTIAATAIAKVLQARGHNMSASTLQRHRRGACLCGDRG